MDRQTDQQWWRQAVVYQVYPRSFADASGDGVGDLRGILDRVPYLAALGVDAVWLSPFFPSPLADGGYDVADHRAVDRRLGTLADFDELVVALHAAGLRLMVDVVPNHTSDRHRWFQAALAAAPGSPERARYVFRDGTGPDGSQPPNDWESVFGGPAWERVADGQWYLHVFAAEQPDLDWSNPEVREDLLETLRFWADRGVDGFRIDVAHGLVKDLSEPYPPQSDLEAGDLPDGGNPLWDRDEVQEVYAGWRRLFASYDPPRVAVAEAWVPEHRLARYALSLGQAFDFGLLEAGWDAGAWRDVIRAHDASVAATGTSSTWVLANHDVIRQVSRYGTPSGTRDDARAWLRGEASPAYAMDRARGLRRARAAVMLVLALPGATYLYQGEELGLPEVDAIPAEERQDPIFHRTAGAAVGRDGCRVPLPWTRTGRSYGFGGDGSHLPQPAWFGALSVEAQAADPASTLTLYRSALALRRRLQGAETVAVCQSAEEVVHVARPGGWHSVTNFGGAPVPLPDGDVVLASGPLLGSELPSDTTVWLRIG